MTVAAIIVGAGIGQRAAESTQGLPKQFCVMEGKTVFQHTVDAFAACGQVKRLVCIVPEKAQRDWPLPYCEGFEGGAKLSLVTGGKTRQRSVLNGLKMLEEWAEEIDIILVHDAARPFVSKRLIEAVIRDARRYGASIAALPVMDSLKKTSKDDEKRIERALAREHVVQAQTPQGFLFRVLLQAHERAADEGKASFCDDAAVYQAYGGKIATTLGERSNWKITSAEDIIEADALFAKKDAPFQMPDIRVGQGYDVHGFQPGGQLILCGVPISSERSLKGHSDADVGLHALTDAILGALAEGDIGQHFPPSDPQWKAASSDRFLSFACKLAAERQARISHLDVTLVCEEPKIAPYRAAMRARIAAITGIETSRISIKATTSEGLGFTGRKEGIAAHAVATLIFQEGR